MKRMLNGKFMISKVLLSNSPSIILKMAFTFVLELLSMASKPIYLVIEGIDRAVMPIL